MASNSPSTSTVDSKEKMDATVQAFNMLAQGKRNLICGEVPTAVTQFQEACKLLAEHYGEMAKECAEAYYCYGSALLDLARMENGVLGNALEGVDIDADATESDTNKEEAEDNLTEDERENLRKQVYDAMAEDESKKTEEKEGKEEETSEQKDAETANIPTDRNCSTEERTGNVQEPKAETGSVDIDQAGEPSRNEDEKANKEDLREAEGDKNVGKTCTVTEDGNGGSGKKSISLENDSKTSSDQVDTTATEQDVVSSVQSGDVDVASVLQKAKESQDCSETSRNKNLGEKESVKIDTPPKDEDKMDSTDKERCGDEVQTSGSSNPQENDRNEKEGSSGETAGNDRNEKEGSGGETAGTEKEGSGGETAGNDAKESQETTGADGKICTESVEGADGEQGKKDNQQVEEMEVESKTEELVKKEADNREMAEGETREVTEDEKMENEEEKEHNASGCEEKDEDEEEDDEGEEDENPDGEDADGENLQKDDPDDVPNLQLAWEMLDLAKVIYLKDSCKENQLKGAQAYLKLGEVSMETESYEQAVEDLKACLKLQQDNLEPCDRAVAETHYQLGLASQLNKQYDAAIEHFKAAVKCLEDKIESLKVVVETKPARGPTDFVDPAEKAEQEIKDIKEILPEICNKIEDAQEEMKNMDNLKSLAKVAVGQIFGTDSSQQEGFGASPEQSTDKKPVTDISHLIRKKRKPEEEEAETTAEKKKIRQEESGGDATVSQSCEQNGHKENPEENTTTDPEPMTTG